MNRHMHEVLYKKSDAKTTHPSGRRLDRSHSTEIHQYGFAVRHRDANYAVLNF